MPFHREFGVDLGTGIVKIYDRKNDSITKEVNMAAVQNENMVFAIGNDAYDIYEKTPENIRIVRPMSKGRIHDVLMMEAVLHILLGRCSSFVGRRPTIYFSVPMDMTEIEKRAYYTVARKGRFRRSRILMVEKPVADAIALKIPIMTTNGSLIVNLGDQSTEVSIIADKRVIISRLIPIGGQDFNQAIVNAVRKKNGFVIGLRTAERLKLTLTHLDRDPGEGCRVPGIDVDSGLPLHGVVSSANVSGSVESVLSILAEEIRKIMERIPPQIRTSVMQEGIFLTGGSAHIPGIGAYLENRLGCAVTVSGYYELNTIYGLKQIINRRELHHWLMAP